MEIYHRSCNNIYEENNIIINHITNIYLTSLNNHLRLKNKIISNELREYIMSNINQWTIDAFTSYVHNSNMNLYKTVWEYITNKINIYISLYSK